MLFMLQLRARSLSSKSPLLSDLHVLDWMDQAWLDRARTCHVHVRNQPHAVVLASCELNSYPPNEEVVAPVGYIIHALDLIQVVW